MTRIVFLGGLLLASSLSAIAAGDQNGCGTNAFQDWFFVDNNRPFRAITGAINRTIKLNSGDPWDDGDWNIHVKPDDSSVSRNSSGTRNEDGLIEFEINSRGVPSDLSAQFPVGTRVEGFGEWVEDGGHSRKTELHLLRWLRTLDRNPTRLFVAQDDTGRFVNAQNVLWEPFVFPLTLNYPRVKVGAIPLSRTQVLSEKARIARGTSSATISPSGLELWIFLDGWWFSDCESVGRVTYGDAPHYAGAIERGTQGLLREQLTYSVSTETGTGQKIANLKVVVDLDPPSQGAIAQSQWTYESSAGVTGTIVQNVSSAPHRLTFTMPYAPALGYNQSSWRMSVAASTVPLSGRLPSGSTEFAQDLARTFVAEGRVYALDGSAISLDRQHKGTGVCSEAVYLTINDSKLLPQIGLRANKWYVKKLRDKDGFNVGTPVEVEVTAQAPFNDPGFKAETYGPPNNRRLDVQWEQLGSGQTNLSTVEVKSRAVTELGEDIQTTAWLSAICGIAPYSYAQLMDYSFRLLGKLGYRGELYKVMPRASAVDRKWLDVLWRFTQGRKLTAAEQKLLVARARQGSGLPPLADRKKLKPLEKGSQADESSPVIIPLGKR